MNTLILNRDTFQMPDDGWYQIAPVGEFPHSGAGVVQVVDRTACEAMANAFKQESQNANFAGLLIDFDHFSLDEKLKSEAAGWIIALEARGSGQLAVGSGQADGLRGEGSRRGAENAEVSNAGLWARIRWSDAGEACVRGGRYRFISPVWSRADCVSVGTDEASGQEKLRPVRLLNAAVTNDPNLKGMRPLSNRKAVGSGQLAVGSWQSDGLRGSCNGENGTLAEAQGAQREIANASPSPEKRLKWVLGENDRNCPSCAALAGQVHLQADWDAAGIRPGAAKLYCQGHCQCRLVETDDPARGALRDVPMRKEEVVNRVSEDSGRLAVGSGQAEGAEIANNWSDAARAASLAVRRAKAAGRKKRRGDKDEEGSEDRVRRKPAVEPPEADFLPVEGIEPPPPEDDDVNRPLPVDEDFERTLEAMEDYRSDAERAFRDEFGYRPSSAEDVAWAEEMAGIPEEYRTRGEITTEELTARLTADDESSGITAPARDGDPGHQALERDAARDASRERTERQEKTEAVHVMAEGLMDREAAGDALNEQEKAFLKQYREIVGDLDAVRRDVLGNRDAGMQVEGAAREAVRAAKARLRASRGE